MAAAAAAAVVVAAVQAAVAVVGEEERSVLGGTVVAEPSVQNGKANRIESYSPARKENCVGITW